MFEDDGSSSVLVFRASRSGLCELPAHLGKSDSCSDCQSMCVVGNVELASDAGNCLQRAQFLCAESNRLLLAHFYPELKYEQTYIHITYFVFFLAFYHLIPPS